MTERPTFERPRKGPKPAVRRGNLRASDVPEDVREWILKLPLDLNPAGITDTSDAVGLNRAMIVYQRVAFVSPITCGKDANHQLPMPRVLSAKDDEGRSKGLYSVAIVCPDCQWTSTTWPARIVLGNLQKAFTLDEAVKELAPPEPPPLGPFRLLRFLLAAVITSCILGGALVARAWKTLWDVLRISYEVGRGHGLVFTIRGKKRGLMRDLRPDAPAPEWVKERFPDEHQE